MGFRHGGDALARRRVHHVRALQRSRTLRVRDEAHDGRRRHRQLAQGAQGTNRGVAIGLICSKHRFTLYGILYTIYSILYNILYHILYTMFYILYNIYYTILYYTILYYMLHYTILYYTVLD